MIEIWLCNAVAKILRSDYHLCPSTPPPFHGSEGPQFELTVVEISVCYSVLDRGNTNEYVPAETSISILICHENSFFLELAEL
jgi:hypothetical protein